MNKIYIIQKITESDQWDGDYDIPVTTIVQEAELINTIIPADGNAPFYEVVPFHMVDNHNRIEEQKPIYSNGREIKKPINSIYVSEIFTRITLALEESFSKNIDIIVNRGKRFKSNQSSIGTVQSDLDHLQDGVKEGHELEKRLNPSISEEAIDYYTYLLEERIKGIKNSTEKEEKKGRKLVHENKNNNQWYFI